MATVREQFVERMKKEEEAKKKKQEQEEQKIHIEKPYVYSIYQCTNCGFMIDETKPPHKPLLKDLKKCPQCGKIIRQGVFKKITKEKMVEIQKNQRQKEEREKEKEKQKIEITLKSIRKDIEYQTLDLLKDLVDDLKNSEITPERLIVIFMNISARIAEARINQDGRHEYMIDLRDYRKLMLSMCQDVTDAYDFELDCEKIYDEYDFTQLEDDTNYHIYEKKYLEADQHARDEHELAKRVNATLEEEEWQKAMEQAEKEKKRAMTRNEKLFKEMLENSVNKADN